MTAPAVETAALSCAYGERLALDAATLSVARGEIFALLGPNGGGKTTLFRILATLLRATSGTFRIDGLDPAADVRAVRRRLGVVFQTPGLDRKLTVKENLALQGALFSLPATILSVRIPELLRTFRLEDRAGDLVETSRAASRDASRSRRRSSTRRPSSSSTSRPRASTPERGATSRPSSGGLPRTARASSSRRTSSTRPTRPTASGSSTAAGSSRSARRPRSRPRSAATS